jgi:hypothetical protein
MYYTLMAPPVLLLQLSMNSTAPQQPSRDLAGLRAEPAKAEPHNWLLLFPKNFKTVEDPLTHLPVSETCGRFADSCAPYTPYVYS